MEELLKEQVENAQKKAVAKRKAQMNAPTVTKGVGAYEAVINTFSANIISGKA